jgi:hydrogenase nickel incorporation protein HypA/HybF
MHEMSIAQNLLEMIRDQLSELELNSARVKVVRMRIGEMAGVLPDSLQFCFGVASEGTAAQGARLAFEEIPIKCRCRNCGTDFGVECYVFICPKCGSPDVYLLSGNELDVVELELDE